MSREIDDTYQTPGMKAPLKGRVEKPVYITCGCEKRIEALEQQVIELREKLYMDGGFIHD